MTNIYWDKFKIKKIMLIKMRFIGDVVLVTPLIKSLKAAMPKAEMFILVNQDTAGILEGHPMVDKILPFDIQRSKTDFYYMMKFMLNIRRLNLDMVIDLTRNDRSVLFTWFSGAEHRIGYLTDSCFKNLVYTHMAPYLFGKIHTVDHHLLIAKNLGLPTLDVNPLLGTTVDDRLFVRNLLTNAGLVEPIRYVVIHPGARRWYKSWPLDRFACIADMIKKSLNIPVVLSGGPSDQTICDEISSKVTEKITNLCARVPLNKFPALIQQSELLIGNDSAAIHIATAVNTPVIALFGPTRWEDWQPRRSHDMVLFAERPCRPCGHSKINCPFGSAYCMSQITTEQVWNSVIIQLSRNDVEIKKSLNTYHLNERERWNQNAL